MPSTFSLMIVAFATCSMVARIALAGSEPINHRVNYYKINEHLEKEVGKSSDNDEAMIVASNWLKSLEKLGSESLSESVRLFVSLKELADPSTCNEKGYKILSENNQALNGLARYGIRVIDRIALDYAQRHAEACCGKYEENFNRKKVQIDANNLELVKSFSQAITMYALEEDQYQHSFGARVLEEALRSSPINYIRLMDDKGSRKRDPDTEAVVLREFLRELMGEERPTEDSFRKAYVKYVQEPCQEYVNAIGADVFEPVNLDEITRLDSRGKVAECDDGSMDYRLGLAYYKVCQMYILGKENLLPHLIRSVN